jgi:hypothetical protein
LKKGKQENDQIGYIAPVWSLKTFSNGTPSDYLPNQPIAFDYGYVQG